MIATAAPEPDFSDTIERLRNLQAQRVTAKRSEVSLMNQCYAMARRAMGWQVDYAESTRKQINAEAQRIIKAIWKGETLPEGMESVVVFATQMQAALDVVQAYVAALEKEMKRRAKSLPVWAAWCVGVCGFGELGLAVVVGEAGNLGNYTNPAKLWKRMGLAPKRCYHIRTKKGEDAFVIPRRRRSAMWVYGDLLFNRGKENEYHDLFVERKALEVEKAHEEGLEVVTTTKDTVERWKKNGLPEPVLVKKADKTKHRTVAHISNRAHRIAEKRFLRNLWRAWREASGLCSDAIANAPAETT